MKDTQNIYTVIDTIEMSWDIIVYRTPRRYRTYLTALEESGKLPRKLGMWDSFL